MRSCHLLDMSRRPESAAGLRGMAVLRPFDALAATWRSRALTFPLVAAAECLACPAVAGVRASSRSLEEGSLARLSCSIPITNRDAV